MIDCTQTIVLFPLGGIIIFAADCPTDIYIYFVVVLVLFAVFVVFVIFGLFVIKVIYVIILLKVMIFRSHPKNRNKIILGIFFF